MLPLTLGRRPHTRHPRRRPPMPPIGLYLPDLPFTISIYEICNAADEEYDMVL